MLVRLYSKMRNNYKIKKNIVNSVKKRINKKNKDYGKKNSIGNSLGMYSREKNILNPWESNL